MDLFQNIEENVKLIQTPRKTIVMERLLVLNILQKLPKQLAHLILQWIMILLLTVMDTEGLNSFIYDVNLSMF